MQSDCGEGTSGGTGTGSKKKAWKEVPDVSWWGTCFSLFQTAWVRAEPEMNEPLTATYREIMVRLARRHPWQQVVKYDRRFRQEAARKKGVKWGEEKTNLVFDMVCNTPGSRHMAIVGLRKGSSIREREVLVLDATKQTVYAHLERNADSLTSSRSVGGDHPATQCHSKSGGKGSA